MSGVPPRPRGRKRRPARAAKPAAPPATQAVDPVVHTPVLRPPRAAAPPPPPLPPELRPSRQEDSADCIRLAFDKTLSSFLEHVEQGQEQQALLLGQGSRVVAQANADLLRLQKVFLNMLPPGASHGR